jgi:cell division protein FtsI/penicillin-binding protein 2
MVADKWRITWWAPVVLFAACAATASAATGSRRNAAPAVTADSLFSRTAAKVLERKFSSPDISYLLMDIRSRRIIAERWESDDAQIPVGSLVKPFTALAYAEAHWFRFPEYTCSPGQCWYPRGHGKLGIVKAVAFSCNSYFVHLDGGVRSTEVSVVARRFGLNGPGDGASAEMMAGEHGVWRESPEALSRAYAELIRSRSQPGVREIVAGMAGSAKWGTALALAKEAPNVSALSKTGTAPCLHKERAPGDGFVMVAWPADSPQHLLLVRYHGHPGAQAAAVAGQMLHALQP